MQLALACCLFELSQQTTAVGGLHLYLSWDVHGGSTTASSYQVDLHEVAMLQPPAHKNEATEKPFAVMHLWLLECFPMGLQCHVGVLQLPGSCLLAAVTQSANRVMFLMSVISGLATTLCQRQKSRVLILGVSILYCLLLAGPLADIIRCEQHTSVCSFSSIQKAACWPRF